MAMRRSGVLLKLALLAVATVLALAALEVVVRVLQPFGNRMRGNLIVLPVLSRSKITNHVNAKVEREIVTTYNALGFRGPEPPEQFGECLTIVAVGGSTTQCAFLGDGTSWPELVGRSLAVKFPRSWVNNAGLDGHSTFGHTLLVEQHLHRLAPDFCLFLVGVNELGRNDLSTFDATLDASTKGFWNQLSAHSELVSVVRAFVRTRRAVALGVQHGHDDLQAMPDRDVPPATREELLEYHRARSLPAYRDRLTRLLQRTRAIPSEPVLITQPALYGPGIDPSTGVDLGRRAVDADYLDGAGLRRGNGQLWWEILELYNDVTREVARATKTELIELARTLPKDSALYYDWVHFTARGAQAVAAIVHERLAEILRARGHGG